MKNTQTQRIWFLISAGIVLLLSILSCSSTATPVDVHGFSNLEFDNHTLWFGAGYKLYQVDLTQQSATVVYDANDVVISFVRVDGNRLFFGGYHSPHSSNGVIWSLDLSTKSIIWKQEVKDSWWRGYIATPPLVDKDNLIVGTRTALYGIDKTQGDVNWQIDNNWFGTGELLTPILADGKLIYGVSNEYFGGDKNLSDRTLAIASPTSGYSG